MQRLCMELWQGIPPTEDPCDPGAAWEHIILKKRKDSCMIEEISLKSYLHGISLFHITDNSFTSSSCRLFLACRRKGEYNVYNYENMGNICI